MGSRIRKNPGHIFEFFAEVARPTDPNEEAFILQQYPLEFDDQEVIKSLPKFVFPLNPENPSSSNVVELFTFVLTDIDGKFKFGFCRHGTTGAQTCLCIISHFPWYETFYKLLNETAEKINSSSDYSPNDILDVMYNMRIPSINEPVDVITPNLKDKFDFTVPDPNSLPEIPFSRNLTEYYNAIDMNNMMIIFASMLYERRVLVVSRKLSRLTSCIHGAATLLYPMYWQHLYIPVLPMHLLDYCSAPMPYLIGVHSSLWDTVQNKQEVGDAVILDADNNTVITEHDDLGALPAEILRILKKRLKSMQTEKMKATLLGDGVARAFLRALVGLIGGYRDALRFKLGEQITFDSNAFIQSRPPSMQPFLEKMLHLQIFEQFVQERLEKLNSGEGFNDAFEIEANIWADKTDSSNKYIEWSSSMKKQGKKFKSKSKDTWKIVSTGVKKQSMKAYKDIRSRIDEIKKDDDNKPGVLGTVSDFSLRRHRPPRPPAPGAQRLSSIGSDRTRRRSSYESHSRQYNVINLDTNLDTEESLPASRRLRMSTGHSQDDGDIDLNMERLSLGLMDDPDIQNVFKKSYSMEDMKKLQEFDEEEIQDEEDYGYTQIEEVAEDALAILGELNDGSSSASLSSLDQQMPTSQRLDSIIRPRPVTPSQISQGSGSSSGTYSDGMIPKPPVAAPRARKTNVSNHPLISLDSNEPVINVCTSSTSQPGVNTSASQSTGKVPPKRPPPPNRTSSGQSQGGEVASPDNPFKHDTFDPFKNSSLNNSAGQSISQVNDEVSDGTLKKSVSRTGAFYNAERPPSIQRRSIASMPVTKSQSVKEARTAFMQSEVPKTCRTNELDQFDPLVTGQLVVDKADSANDQQEDNLLKEWNLPFRKVAQAPPPVSPKPVLASRPCSIYGYPSASANFPPQAGLSAYATLPSQQSRQRNPVYQPSNVAGSSSLFDNLIKPPATVHNIPSHPVGQPLKPMPAVREAPKPSPRKTSAMASGVAPMSRAAQGKLFSEFDDILSDKTGKHNDAQDEASQQDKGQTLTWEQFG